MDLIYLDNAATTQMDTDVFNEMFPYIRRHFGNPGSIYTLGAEAKEAVDIARERVARLFHTTPEHIIFTSGGSEANNLMVKGAINRFGREVNRFFLGMTEHGSLDRAVRESRLSYYAYLDRECNLDTVDVLNDYLSRQYLDASYDMVTLMYVNNETGEVNDVKEISNICAKYGVLFGTDCVQAAGYYDLDTTEILADYMTISSHKIHGPKGVGALYVRDINRISPLIHGGINQEFGLRGGTENVPGIVGFGKAAELALQGIDTERNSCKNLSSLFIDTITGGLKEYGLFNIFHINRIEGREYSDKILNIRFDGIDGETLLLLLDKAGICVSAGSACNARVATPSRTLIEMGLSNREAANSVRVSFSYTNSIEEVRAAAKNIVEIVASLVHISAEVK